MISVNARVKPKVRRLIERDEELGCRAYRMENGTRVIDMGIEVPGSWEAARLFTEIDTGDLASVSYRSHRIDERYSAPAVEIYADRLEIACIAAQISGWKLENGAEDAVGSGPARALAEAEGDFHLRHTDYRDTHHEAVLGLQTTALPTLELAREAARACGVDEHDLYLLVHPSSSITASVQVSARIIEQTINQMIHKEFDVKSLVRARGWCAVAPVTDDEAESMGRINDSLLYGGEAEFWIRGDDAQLEALAPRLVTSSARDYGRLFGELFERAGGKYYAMDPEIHSPAKVQLFNVETGRGFSAGEIRNDILRKSYFGR
jgi:methenyltetrahydromethanopterin cyclohydrolase